MAWKATVMTTKKVEEFKRAFSMWFTKAEACLYCKVNESTFYEYCSKWTDEANAFVELIPTLQSNPKLMAKMNILESLETKWSDTMKQRIDDSKWLLEKTDKDFNPKSVVEQTVKADVEVTKNQQGLLDRLIG